MLPCSFQHAFAFGPYSTEFVYPECWHFCNDETSMIDDVLTEHDVLLDVLPLNLHLTGPGPKSLAPNPLPENQGALG